MWRGAGGVAVRAEGLRVVRGGRPVLKDVGFCVSAGSVTGVLRPSGCGKTTLLRAVVGLQARVRGHLEVLGLAAWWSALRCRIGYVTQAPAIYLDLMVRENLRYFAAARRLPWTRFETPCTDAVVCTPRPGPDAGGAEVIPGWRAQAGARRRWARTLPASAPVPPGPARRTPVARLPSRVCRSSTG